MADFCMQCSKDLFDQDCEDMAGQCKEDEVIQALCEDCGPCYVTHTGQCVGPCLKPHHLDSNKDKHGDTQQEKST